MVKVPATSAVLSPVLDPDFEARPTWDELDREALEENARDPYDGPPIAQLIREDPRPALIVADSSTLVERLLGNRRIITEVVVRWRLPARAVSARRISSSLKR